MTGTISTLEQFIAEIDRAQSRADELIPAATTTEAVEAARVQLVGRTSGVVSVANANPGKDLLNLRIVRAAGIQQVIGISKDSRYL